MSHLGRPDGKVVPKHSLKPVADELQKLLGTSVTFLSDCAGEAVEKYCASPKQGKEGKANIEVKSSCWRI